jgi:hypothetical protein
VEGAAALAASPHLAGLSFLDLSSNEFIEDDQIDNGIGDEEVAQLRARWPFIRL